jgi:hypothetical protein
MCFEQTFYSSDGTPHAPLVLFPLQPMQVMVAPKIQPFQVDHARKRMDDTCNDGSKDERVSKTCSVPVTFTK